MKIRGFTLVELMIVVAILAIVAAIAVPAYNGYIRESRLGAMRMNLDTLRIAVEAYRLEEGTYRDTTAPLATAPYDETEINSVYGWEAEGDSDVYTYLVVSPTSVAYTLQAQVTGGGTWVVCDKDPTKTPTTACCDGKSGAPVSACSR